MGRLPEKTKAPVKGTFQNEKGLKQMLQAFLLLFRQIH